MILVVLSNIDKGDLPLLRLILKEFLKVYLLIPQYSSFRTGSILRLSLVLVDWGERLSIPTGDDDYQSS